MHLGRLHAVKAFEGLIQGGQAADAVAEHHRALGQGLGVADQAGGAQGLVGGFQGELRKWVERAGHAAAEQGLQFGDHVDLDLTDQPVARLRAELAALQRGDGQAADAVAAGLPGGRHVAAERTHGPQAGDGDPPLGRQTH